MNLADIIPINTLPIYEYFNADKNYQRQRIDAKIDEYRTELVNHLFDKIPFRVDNLFQIAHDDFVQKLGKQTIYGTKNEPRFVHVMQELTKLYNLEKDLKGNNLTGKVSIVTLNFDFDKLIKSKNAEDLLVYLYKDVDITDPEVCDITPIDMDSLTAFLKNTDNLNYSNDKVKEYNKEAHTVLTIAEITSGVLPQIINESDFGRRYYKGFNLQNISKIVRNASLGDNYEYDLNTAVYAIKLNYASELTDKKFTYTSEYIEGGGKYKDSIRRRLTLQCFDIDQNDKYFEERVKVIKQAITAIGFGATKSAHGFIDKNKNWHSNSLYDIFSFTIYDKIKGKNVDIPYTKMVDGVKVHSIDLFLNDPWMMEFIKEQIEMTKLLTDCMINDGVVTKDNHPFLVDGRNAINRNKVMAYFFQKTERQIMNTAIKFAEDNGVKVLLRVHDAIHTDKKLDLKELHYLILEQFVSPKMSWLGTKIIAFGETYTNGYHYVDQAQIDEHKAHIEEEERLAHEHFGKEYKPKAAKKSVYHKHQNDFYDSATDYGQQQYDPNNDPIAKELTGLALENHYRIVGYKPKTNNLPDFINKIV